MPRYPKYQPDSLQIIRTTERPATWSFTREPVSGTEFTYAVVDGNFRSRNVWEFTVRVPEGRDERVEVRPRLTPSLAAWAGLERRSLTFTRARKSAYRGWLYGQVALADPTGERTKDVVRIGQRASLPPWFATIESRLRRKETVRATRANDADELVALVRPDEHERMIALFFATKVWILKESVVLPA
jgi:hypothetical protein